MKILHLNTNDINGGAARAAHRLHTGLRQIGRDSTLFVLSRRSKDPSVQVFKPSKKIVMRLHRRLRREQIQRSFLRYKATRPASLEPFTDGRAEHGSHVFRQLPSCDIVNLHWIRDFIDILAFFEHVLVPVVWTLHDMNAFTGGCHYDHGCGKFIVSCGACPQLGSEDEHDLSRKSWEWKKAVYDRIDPDWFHLVAPSYWLANEVARSALFRRFSISVIPYGLDTEIFAPRDSAGIRQALGISARTQVLLFLADSAVNHRKGFALFAQALEGLSECLDVLLLSVGGRAPDIPLDLPHRHLGQIEQDWLLSLIYSAADVFVIPSLQDNLPNTVLEAMACGTPVVGFDAGGIPEMVRTNVTGLLAEVGNVRALRDAVVQLLNDEQKRVAMSVTCRRIVKEEYTLEVQAKRYVKLYEEMLHRSAGPATHSFPTQTLDTFHALSNSR